MKRLLFATVTAAAILLGVTNSALAWNSCGHESVALVAYDQLSPDDRAKLVAILQHHPRLEKDLLVGLQPGDDKATVTFIVAATWPDVVRDPTNPLNHIDHHATWHYVDFPYELNGVKGPVPDLHWDSSTDMSQANLDQAFQKVTTQFVDPAITPDRRAVDLCWIEHLTGDIHQPLHAVSLYSAQYPQGDKGGNLVYFKPPFDPDRPDQQLSNLHHFWDGLMGYKLKLADIRPIADRVEHEHPAKDMAGRVADMQVLDWAHESYDLAVANVYDNGAIPGVPREAAHGGRTAPELPPAYLRRAQQVGDLRVALAGYRLANELHSLLSKLPTTSPTAASEPASQ